MIRLANVIVVHAESAAVETMTARLSHNGYHAQHAVDHDQVLRLAGQERPDLILVGDGSGATLKADPALADIPMVLLTDAVTAQAAEQAYAAGLDDAVSPAYDDVELFSRLRPLVRLATMHSELRLRAEAARPFGLSIAERLTAREGARPCVLVVGTDRDGVAAVLGTSAEVVSSVNLYDAESLLEHRNFDAAVLTAEGDPEAGLAFVSQVRNNPRLFNLPMVVLTDKGTAAAEIYRRGASRVLVRPMDAGILRAAVLSMVRRQQLRWSIRGALFESLTEATRDPLTGVYGRAFLESYLERRLSGAKQHHRHLAVVLFSVPNVEGVRAHFGDDAAEHLAQQLGQWITGLLRAEDLTAVYGRNQFCVVLPDTPTVEAEVVMHRIAGVLAYTDFAVREVYQPIKVWVQVACTDARTDDTVETLLARVQGKLD